MNETNMDAICRLCLNSSFLHYNIFVGPTADSSPTYQIINYAYDLQISADDGLPEYICENCFALVKAFQVYKTNAHKARSEIIRLKQEMVKDREGLVVPVDVAVTVTDFEERKETEVFVKQEENSIDIDGSSNSGMPVYQQNLVEQEDYIGQGVERFASFGGHYGKEGDESHVCKQDSSNQMPLEQRNIEAGTARKYNCHICNKFFKEKCTLMAHHSSQHSGDKAFQCIECLKRFKTKGSLLTHSRTHVAVKPYGCDVCWKRFSRKDTLTSHLVTHTNDRPYKCHLCEKRYTFKRALRRHLKVHNPT